MTTKKSLFIVFGLLFVVLFATRPSEYEHRTKIRDFISNSAYYAVRLPNSDYGIVRTLILEPGAKQLPDDKIAEWLDNDVWVQDYLLFTVAKDKGTWSDNDLAFGFLGEVFIRYDEEEEIKHILFGKHTSYK